MKKINDIYKIRGYDKKVYYLICLVENNNYLFIRDCEWGYVSNCWVSESNPIEFIAQRLRAINIKTSSGVDLIKRIYRQNLPLKVKELIKEYLV